MLSINEQNNDRLILGPRRGDELVGLCLFGLGLLATSVGLFGLFEYKKLSPQQNLAILAISYYIIPLGIVGFLILFFQKRFVFECQHGVLIHLRWLRQPQNWKLTHFNAIAVIQTTDYGGHLELHGDYDLKVRIGSGGMKDCLNIAQAIHELIGLPVMRSFDSKKK